MNTPVAFFIYKRPEYTRRVWAEICKAKPPVLLIVADGPREEADRIKCEVTQAVVAQVDWPCDVRRNYSPVNLGCRERMASGLNWVFEQVEEAIILEDDCLPHPSFFDYCETLLAYYRNDNRVMHIGGNYVQKKELEGKASYYFSRCVHIWGWATWRRAWRFYDLNVATWPVVRDSDLLRSRCAGRGERAFWSRAFERQYRGMTKTWDYSWVYTVWVQHGLAIVPRVNLVSNIGLGADSTHQQDDKWYMNMPTAPISPIVHPEILLTYEAADRWTYHHMFKPSLWDRMRATVLNPWAYGVWIRKLPVVGAWWARWRSWWKKTVRRMLVCRS